MNRSTDVIAQFVFVGHHKDRVLDSVRKLRELPVSKVVLFVGEEDLPGEDVARKTAEELKRELEVVYDVEIAKINKRNVLKCALQLIELIRKEKSEGREVLLNVSGSLRSVAIAAYIAACVTNSKIVTSIPKYNEKGEEVGIEEVIEVPTLPIDFPGEEQIQILFAIDGGVDSLDELVFRLNPGIKKNTREFRNERSRLSHHLAKLERMGLIRREKVGKNVRIVVTELGKIVSGLA